MNLTNHLSSTATSTATAHWNPLPLLRLLGALPIAAGIVVFGSVARGKKDPADIDIAYKLADGNLPSGSASPERQQLQRVLAMARSHYARLDPFVISGKRLLVRNAEATGWEVARNATNMRESIAREGRPLLDVLAWSEAGVSKPHAEALDHSAVTAIASRFGLPRTALVELLTLTVAQLRGRDRYCAMNNEMSPAHFPRLAVSSAKIASFNTDVRESYVDYLDVFDARRLRLSEAEAGIKRHPTYRRYVEMRREGHEPPYIDVYEAEDGALVTSNRRRTLVSQELGLPITGWRGVLNRETGLPLKYGDVLNAYAESVAAAVWPRRAP